ncbi:MAG TPA: BamA/TamA family outer membrane protein [Candidatus Kapabacteria bacterium]|nr:BamA/TamA family outer membrane protein [Candidatus Kapabacteria bacterium]
MLAHEWPLTNSSHRSKLLKGLDRIAVLSQDKLRAGVSFFMGCSLVSVALSGLLIVGFAGPQKAMAQLTGPEEREARFAPPGEVVVVNFEGNHALSTDELLTVVTTKATGWSSRFLYSISFKKLGATYEMFDATMAQHDTTVLNEYYRDHGYLEAKSTYRVSPNRDDLREYEIYLRNERLRKASPNESRSNAPKIRDTVTFTIHEGPPFTIARVAVEGLESLPNEFQPELTEHMTIKAGEQWSRPVAAKEAQRLTGIMVQSGYPNFKADTIIVEHIVGKRTVNVLLYFRPGHRYRYGSIHIIWDTTSAERSQVAAKVILSQLYIDSGHWYMLSEIQRSETRLYKLGTFDLARISLDTNYINTIPDSLRDSAIVPVDVNLRMRLRAEIPLSIFGGTGSQGLVLGGSVGFTNHNFTQSADNLNFQASWQPLPTTQRHYSSNIDYLLPYIGLDRIPLILGIGASEQDQFPVASDPTVPTYTQRSYSAHAGTSIILSKTDDKTTINPDLLIDYIVSTGVDSVLKYLPSHQVNLLPSVTYQDDRTNNLINPTSGNFLSMSAEFGVPTRLFGSPSSYYVKATIPTFKYYHDFSDTGLDVIATRLQVGASWLFKSSDTTRDPSLDRRFYGGGAISNRGWGEQSLVVSNNLNPVRNALYGGYNDLEANVEFRWAPFNYPGGGWTSWQSFSSSVRVVMFYDIGNVWDNTLWSDVKEALKFSMLAQSIGLGLRYNTFFGALRIDCGFKLYDPSGRFDNNTNEITTNSQGGWLFSSHRVLFHSGYTFNWHFGLGQAF